jgi:hypothetical protein
MWYLVPERDRTPALATAVGLCWVVLHAAVKIAASYEKRRRLEEEREEERRELRDRAQTDRDWPYFRQADRLALAAVHYRQGKAAQGLKVLESPATDWSLIAEAAAASPESRARQLADILAQPEGPTTVCLAVHRATDRRSQLRDLHTLQQAVMGRVTRFE